MAGVLGFLDGEFALCKGINLNQFQLGAEIFWELFFFILGINFFLWFQLEVETFQVGVGCPCSRPKKKTAGGGCALPPRCIRMIFGALGSQFLVGALGSYNFGALGSLKIWCCVQKLVVSSQNF